MNTTVINIKTHPQIKARAQQVAEELGFSLSSLINAYLRQLIKTKTITFSASDEEPTEYLLEMLQKSKDDKKKSSLSPQFMTAADATTWLNQK